MKTILVTGGTGFIGSHTVIQLLEQGYTPVIIDTYENSDSKSLDRIEKISGVKPAFYEVSCQDTKQVIEICQRHQVDGIIHFAAYKAVGESVEDPLKYYDNNIGGLISILRVAESCSIANFVFSSSCTVYGDVSLPHGVDENQAISKAFSPYGNTKVIGEQIIADFQKANPQIKVCLLRYFNPIGAHPSGLNGELPIGVPNNLLPYITQTALGIREELTVFGNNYATKDGTCVRDYIHVCDLADAHILALNYLDKQEQSSIEYFNVGTGNGTTVLEMIAVFENLMGKPLNWKFGERRSGDVESIYANPAKIQNTLQWKARYTVKDAIEHAWKWEKQRMNEN